MAKKREQPEAAATTRPSAPLVDVQTPAPPTPTAAPTATTPPKPGRFRVSLPGVRVRIEDAQGRVSYEDHLNVEAANAEEAWMQFAAHNGIPLTMDALTGRRKLASLHEPVVQPLE